MIILTIEETVSLHEKLIEKTGGSHGIRDIGLLESAIYSAESSFDDVEIYPSVEEKAARLLFSLTSNHAFVDGNKRIGVLVMLISIGCKSEHDFGGGLCVQTALKYSLIRQD